MIDESRLDEATLDRIAMSRAEGYRQARPFPHVVFDDFLPSVLVSSVVREFPAPGTVSWFTYDSNTERKLEFTDDAAMGAATRRLLSQLNSSMFITFLEKLTGINGLVPDPHYVGGGLHQIERGGYLEVHADFNRHPRTGLERRLNLLLYLNPDWIDEYGGHLELWDREMMRCEARILPVLNRCVVFSTDRYSYHGHPQPLSCPPEWTRKSLALYYYSASRPGERGDDGDHSTLFQDRPGAKGRDGEDAERSFRRAVPPIALDTARLFRERQARRAAVSRLLPPAAVDWVRASRRRRTAVRASTGRGITDRH
jgi:hypothetical protein